MVMTKEAFQTKIEAGKVVVYGRYSFYKMSGDYYFHGEETEIFKSFEKLWSEAKFFILFGVNYSEGE